MRLMQRDSYWESEILEADPLKLVRMLYRGAIEAIRRAEAALESGEIEQRTRQVTKAMEIVSELMLSVDRERGGKVAANLVEIYDYVLRKLGEGHVEQSSQRFVEAVMPLETLLEAWDEIGSREAVVEAPPAAGMAADYSPLSVSC
jgi:flagellar protein FliS